MPPRRRVVNTPVGLGTPNKYQLKCPGCGIVNGTPDGGTEGVATVDGILWYRFNCRCGTRYKAKAIPMTVGLTRLGDL